MGAQPTTPGQIDETLQTALEQPIESLLHLALALPLSSTERQHWIETFVEIQYWVRGGGKCSICNAPVRDRMHITSTDDGAFEREYDCLCRRCMEAEKAFSRRVSLFEDGALVQEYINTKPLIERPSETKIPAAA